MVHLATWEDFNLQARALYEADPTRTRYTIKYQSGGGGGGVGGLVAGKVTLKVTNDKVCVQYATDQAADLKKIEKLNQDFFVLMSDASGDECLLPVESPIRGGSRNSRGGNGSNK